MLNAFCLGLALAASPQPVASSTFEARPNAGWCVHDCWMVHNHSTRPQRVSCSGMGKDPLLDSQVIEPSADFTVRFDSPENEGIGFSGPGVPFKCSVVDTDGRKDAIGFLSLSYGDTVHIDVFDQKFRVTVLEHLLGKREQTTEMIRSHGERGGDDK